MPSTSNRSSPVFIENEQARQAWNTAQVIIAPGNGGRRTYELLRERLGRPAGGEPQMLNIPAIRERSTDGTPRVGIPSDARDALGRAIDENTTVLLVDDVASTYQTIAAVTNGMRARSIGVLTLLATDLQKPEYMEMLGACPPMTTISGGIVLNRTGDPAKTPGITTTAGMLENTPKAERSRRDLGGYLGNNDEAIRLLMERTAGSDLQLLFLDLDGTSLLDGSMPAPLRNVLLNARDRLFAVAATGRNAASYRSLPAESRDAFRAAILDDGLTLGINGTDIPVVQRNINDREVQKRLERAARDVSVRFLVTRKGATGRLPWAVRIRAAGNDVATPAFTSDDTEAAFRLADAFDDDDRFSLTPTGYGDATLTWKGFSKGTSGLGGLARSLPTLPPLQTAIAAGDGPNDIALLRRVKEAGGLSIAVRPVCDAVRQAAGEVLADPQDLPKRLQTLLLQQDINRALAETPLLGLFGS